VRVSWAQVQQQLVVGATQAFALQMRRLGPRLDDVQRVLGRTLDLKLLPSSTRKNVNLRIADLAATRVANGWRERLPANAPPYRVGENRLSGTLDPALQNIADMTADTTDRVISFINVSSLNSQARHWYRVNYGAAGPNLAARNPREQYVVEVGGRPAFRIQDKSNPDPRNMLPHHFFSYGIGAEFVPLRGPADRPSNGVRAARFTDLGLQSIQRNFGPEYMKMFNRWLQDRANEVKFKKIGITVHQAFTLSGRPQVS
jgi:hypothetical protein